MDSKHWYQSKTIRLAILQGVIGIFTALLATNPDLQSVGYIVIIKSFLDIALRYVTDQPII